MRLGCEDNRSDRFERLVAPLRLAAMIGGKTAMTAFGDRGLSGAQTRSLGLLGLAFAEVMLFAGCGSGDSGGREGVKFGRIPPALVAYAPNDAFVLGYSNIKKQLKAFGNDKTQARAHLTRDIGAVEKDYGPAENIEEMLSVQRSGGFTTGTRVHVVRFAKPPDKTKLTAGAREVQVKGKKYFERTASKDEPGFGGKVLGEYLHFPSDTLLVRTDTKALMEEVIGGDVGKFPEAFRALMDEADGYIIEARRPTPSNKVVTAAGAIAVISSRSKTGNTVTVNTIEEYMNERDVLAGRKFWDELATARRLPGEEVNVRVSGLRIVIQQNAPADVSKGLW